MSQKWNWFESRAVLDGSQTVFRGGPAQVQFESRAVLDGSQTPLSLTSAHLLFESRAVLDGSQTGRTRKRPCRGLRVVLF